MLRINRTRLRLKNSRNQIYGLINCVAPVNCGVRTPPPHSVILLCWTDSLARPPLVRWLFGRITTLMSVRLLVMEALASSNMADMPLINLIGKSTGCLACCITSAHPSDSLLKPSVSSVTGLSRCQNNFPSLEQNLAINLQPRSAVLHNLLFSLRIHGFFPG